jgi:transcriptional regulator with XRE-family HTH domain
MSDHREIFARRLREVRESKVPKLSQRAAAKLLGFSQSALSLWELGKNMPELNVMVKLAEFYDVPLDFLQGTVDTPRVRSTYEIATVPLLPLAALAKWDFKEATTAVQTSQDFAPGTAAAVMVNSDLLHSTCAPGDIVIVERDQRLIPNGIYYLIPPDSKEPVLRQCTIDGAAAWFTTEILTIPALPFGPGVKIVGRVREIVRRTLL